MQLFDLPADWNVQDVEELCEMLGTIQTAQPSVPCTFVATYTDTVATNRAVTELNGLQMPGDNGVGSLRCCIVNSDGAIGASQPATNAEDESSKKPKSQPEVRVPVAAAQLSPSVQLFDMPAEWSV